MVFIRNKFKLYIVTILYHIYFYFFWRLHHHLHNKLFLFRKVLIFFQQPCFKISSIFTFSFWLYLLLKVCNVKFFSKYELENKSYIHLLKGCVCYIFASLFLSLKESIWKSRKNAFFSLQKPFSFSRKSNFRILDIYSNFMTSSNA